MADFSQLQTLIADNRAILALLSPSSSAVLLSALGESLEMLWRWQGSGEYGGLSVSEAVTVREWVAQAESELMSSSLIGTIFPYATSAAPAGSLDCDGSTYDRVDYPLLYAVLDSVFIIDADTFRVPDLTNRFVLGAGDNDPGDTGGETEHTLTEEEMPNHAHGYTGVTLNLDLETPGAPDFQAAGILPFQTTDSAGGDGAHNNMPPYLALRWAIWAL